MATPLLQHVQAVMAANPGASVAKIRRLVNDRVQAEYHADPSSYYPANLVWGSSPPKAPLHDIEALVEYVRGNVP